MSFQKLEITNTSLIKIFKYSIILSVVLNQIITFYSSLKSSFFSHKTTEHVYLFWCSQGNFYFFFVHNDIVMQGYIIFLLTLADEKLLGIYTDSVSNTCMYLHR